MVEGSSTAQVVEEVVAPEVVTTTTEVVAETAVATATTSEVAATTTEVVAATTEIVATTTDVVATTSEMVVETAEAAVEASCQSDDIVVHRTGKEIVEDPLPGAQGEAAAAESGGEEYFDFCSDFFGPASIVGSAAFRSRDRVPHPNDIPNRGRTFDNERLEKVWWDQVEKIDKLKYPPLVFSTFAQTTMDVSISRILVFVFCLCFLLFFLQKALEQIATVGEYHRQLIELRQEKEELCVQAERW